MTTTDYLVLVGIAVTVLGWVVTFLRQMAIAQTQARFNGQVQQQLDAIKEGYARAREYRQCVLPARIAEIQKVNDWFIEGYQLGNEFAVSRLYELGGYPLPDEMQSRLAEARTSYKNWRNSAKRIEYVVLQLELEARSEINRIQETEALETWFDRPAMMFPSLTSLQSLAFAMSTLLRHLDNWDKTRELSELDYLTALHRVFRAATYAIEKVTGELFANNGA